MSRASPIQSSFNSGEWSPLLHARVDIEAYKSALGICLNQVPLIQGPLTRRPGTYHVSEVRDSTKSTRIVPFQFSNEQAYVLEFGDQYVRFYTNNGPVLEFALDIISITRANPGVVAFHRNTAGVSNGDVLYLDNISTVAAEDADILAGAGWTLVGSMAVQSNDAITSKSSGHFRARRTAANTFTLYRVA